MAIESVKIIDLTQAKKIESTSLFLLTNDKTSNKLAYNQLCVLLNNDITQGVSITDINTRLNTVSQTVQTLTCEINDLTDVVQYNSEKLNGLCTAVDNLTSNLYVNEDGLSARLYNNELRVEAIDSIIGTTEITGTITDNITSLNAFKTTVPTETTFGPIKVGFKSFGTYYGIQVTKDGQAYVEVEGSGGSKPAGYDTLTALVETNTNDIATHSTAIANNKQDISYLATEVGKIDIKAIDNINYAIYGDNQLSDVTRNTSKHLHNLLWRLYDADWREVTTKISSVEFNETLLANGFDLDDLDFEYVSCTYLSSNLWKIANNSLEKTDILFKGISCLNIYPIDDKDFVVGDVLVYKRFIDIETEPVNWVWILDESSYISTYNNDGEIKFLSDCISIGYNALCSEIEYLSTALSNEIKKITPGTDYSKKISDLSTALSNNIDTLSTNLSTEIQHLSTALSNEIKQLSELSQVIYTYTLLSTENEISINVENAVDVPENSYIRIKLYNYTENDITIRINSKQFYLDSDTKQVTCDAFFTVTKTPILAIKPIADGVQLNIIIYKNGYPKLQV